MTQNDKPERPDKPQTTPETGQDAQGSADTYLDIDADEGAGVVVGAGWRRAPGRIPPGLHLVSTPIGAARDITLRALDVFAGADVLAAEDTRSLRRLMEIHGVRLGGRPLFAYHDHNGAQVRPRLMALLAEGKSVAYASEAGTPLVADPGFQLARAATAEGHPVLAAPGASAVLAALAVAGLPSDRFCFVGFPPAQGGARRAWLDEVTAIPATLVMYESPKRVHRLLGELSQHGGREAALCRELTKRYEEVIRGTLDDVARAIEGRDLKGEIVVLLGRPEPREVEIDLDAALRAAMDGTSLREAVDAVTEATGLKRRQVYQRALALAKGDE
ncbi:rRNA small subunit methyltransferase 1 [Rhodobacter sp. NTK016B]|uniref:16S rRNA (cytidine(1402)-2'-O)-methyltransferase n=1 Tax=Rhodobacter sp. NTK016B TaxID=2759676 RepID=UPI001A8C82B8|nr:16S rRNA (cytidine(1402)-2'-O)-methyltransferase [Rhodobacter sp. NTK016B]MBN8294749.1 rRNA small subunit methyltransferase 1 [Rhodobacter sp. NTK016B]